MAETDRDRRVLVTRAGTGSSNNLIRSLRTAATDLTVIGCHSDRFHLRRSEADRNYLIPTLDHPDVANALQFVAAKEQVDLVIPTTDDDVRTVSDLRASLPCRVFLPAPATIALCQDKYTLASRLESLGVPVPPTFAISQLAEVEELFARLAPASRVWCRIRTGTGSLGATAVRSAEQARSWIKYWTDMRGIAVTDFTLSDYLPGRDFACQSVWKDGRVVLLKTTERVSYFGGAGGPSGVSSIGGIHKTVREPAVVDVCVAAVKAIDGAATGAFSIDLKADRRGRPCVTEINVGRFLTGSPIFDLTGTHNMTATYVRLALGQPVQIDEPYDVAEGYYMIRDLDTLPAIFHADELSEGIEDARISTSSGNAGG
jgi:carbamoyl-phosphate synthase large subunit